MLSLLINLMHPCWLKVLYSVYSTSTKTYNKYCCIWICLTHTHTSVEQLLSHAESRKFHISSVKATLTVVLSSRRRLIWPISLKTTVWLLRLMEVCVPSLSLLTPTLTCCVVWRSAGHPTVTSSPSEDVALGACARWPRTALCGGPQGPWRSLVRDV